jgi:hypothetical protein
LSWRGACGLPAALGVEDCGSQCIGVTQSDEVTAGNHDWFDTESLASQRLLELQRKKRSSAPEITVMADGQEVKTQGSRNGRCD